MSTPTPPIDPVTVAIAIATGLFGSTAAQYVGPYAVIIVGALIGAAWSASRRDPGSRIGTAAFILLLIGLAVLVSVPLAEVAARYVGQDSRWMLGPVAVVVAGVGERWPALVRATWRRNSPGADRPPTGGPQ